MAIVEVLVYTYIKASSKGQRRDFTGCMAVAERWFPSSKTNYIG